MSRTRVEILAQNVDIESTLALKDGSTTRLYIDSSGNLAIGNNTSPAGALDVTGNIVVSGTVDGRDVAADGAKLDAIEAGATADQTAAEIKTAYESNNNTNAFTDAEKTKLSGIATGAEVNVNSDWSATTGDAVILNKPSIPTDNAQLTNGAGYITSADGGNAATLDGIDSSQFLRSDQSDSQTGGITINRDNSGTDPYIGLFIQNTVTSAGLRLNNQSTNNRSYEIQSGMSADFFIYDRTSNAYRFHIDSSGVLRQGSSSGNVIWHAGNDGSGSGLDADLLDGYHSTAFGRINSNTYGGTYNIPIYINNQLYPNPTAGGVTITGSSGVLQVQGNTVWHVGNDGSGSGLDADTLDGINSASFLRSDVADNYTTLVQNGSSNGASFTTSGSWGTRHSTSHGYIDFGPANTSHAHIYTDRANFYFNAPLQRSGNIVWDSGNDGSGSGLDADTLDGYHASTTRNSANTIPIRDGNGYLQLGWINTTSGDLGATSPDRVYCSNDGYIRYQDIASFRATVNTTARYTGREQHTSDSSYWVGTMGWSNNTFATLFNYGSGHIDAWSSPSDRPSTEATHWVGHQSLHYTNGTNMYGHQMVVGGGLPGACYLRTRWGTGFTSWYKMWNAVNDGSGSGLDADLLDGQQGSYYLDYNNLTNVPAGSSNANTLDNLDSTQFLRSDAADQKTSGNLRFNDNIKLTLGNSDDSQWYFDGSSTTILNQVTGNRIEFQWGGGWQFRFEINGSALARNAWNTWSDISLKTNIEVIPDALNKVAAIRGVTYDRIDVPDSGRHTGVIAQEVEVVLPEVVHTNEDGIKSVSYGNIVGLLIEAIKEQQTTIQQLTERIEVLEGGN